MAREIGFEPMNDGIRIRCRNRLATPEWLGRLELNQRNDGIKIRCLNHLATSQEYMQNS